MTAPPAGWTPIAVSWRAGKPAVDWCHTAGVRFTEPFFAQTVERCMRHPFRLLFRHRTGIDAVTEAAAARPGLPLAGLVLHLSRCGSTLVAQMLAARDDAHVVSEPGPLEPLLAADTVPVDVRVAWVRSMVAALGQPATPAQRHYVVKLDAWAALDLPLLRAAFPDVPMVFVCRDPLEVLVSQTRQRGYHMVPFALSPERLGLEAADVATMGWPEYGAMVLGRIAGSAATAAREGRLLVVDHRELPDAVLTRIAPHFGMPVGPGEAAAMAAVSGNSAKNPVLGYLDDGAGKHADATDDMRAAVGRWAGEPYQRLLAERDTALVAR